MSYQLPSQNWKCFLSNNEEIHLLSLHITISLNPICTNIFTPLPSISISFLFHSSCRSSAFHLMISRSFWNLVLQFTKWSWLNINSIQTKPVIQNQHHIGHRTQNAGSINKQLFLHWFETNEAINLKLWDPQKWKPPFYLHLLQLLCSLDVKSFKLFPKTKRIQSNEPKAKWKPSFIFNHSLSQNNPKT